jgi:riboflavin kinase/FMN adenylyltransferase
VALHIGPNPTFGEDASKVEAHLLDFQGDLYSVRLELEILDQVRGVKKFSSKEELLWQLHRDIANVRAIAEAQ